MLRQMLLLAHKIATMAKVRASKRLSASKKDGKSAITEPYAVARIHKALPPPARLAGLCAAILGVAEPNFADDIKFYREIAAKSKVEFRSKFRTLKTGAEFQI